MKLFIEYIKKIIYARKSQSILHQYKQIKKHYINVVFQPDGTIIEIETNLDAWKLKNDDIIGKNWFNEFVESKDYASIKIAYDGLINGVMGQWAILSYDIRCQNGKHQFIDFRNEIIICNNQTYIMCRGIPHFEV